MKKILFLIGALLLFSLVKAQSPNKISYQAVIRGASNNLIFNSMVSMRFSVLQGSNTGIALYVETQKPSTNDNGLISVIIGNGVPGTGDLSAIDWSKGPFFLKVETNPLGGNNYTVTGTTQLMSVPYALYSGQADNVSGKITIAHGGTGASNVTDARYNLGLDIDSARVATADALLSANLIAEAARASGSETTLTNNLGNEVTRATAAEGTLTTNLNAEATRASGIETTLTNNLATEVSRATSAESTLTTNLTTENTNRTNADALKEDLANKSTNVTTDGTSDTKYPSVKSVKTYVDASATSGSTALATEITNRTSADETLTTNLNAEATRASGSETTLTNNLGNEVTRATAAESTLTTNLATENTNRTSADALKEDLANKSTSVTTDGTSDTKYPSA